MRLINKFIFYLIIGLFNYLIAQNSIPSNSLMIPFNKLDNELSQFINSEKDEIGLIKKNKINITYNLGFGLLNGHSNIDNNGEL